MLSLKYRPVVIVASGPSLSDEQCALIAERRQADACRVIVVNDNYKRIPNADMLFAADGPWWRVHHSQVAQIAPKVERWSSEPSNRQYGCQVWQSEGGSGIAPRESNAFRRGSSSTFMAVGLSIKLGARHIILVGIDCKRGKDGRSHWFGDHDRKRLPNPQPFSLWRDEFDGLAAPAAEMGIDIVNCTIDTAVRKLRRSTLEAELFPPEGDDLNDVKPDRQIEAGEQQQKKHYRRPVPAAARVDLANVPDRPA